MTTTPTTIDAETATIAPQGPEAVGAAPAGSEDLTQRLLDATLASLELFGVHLGVKLGLYRALDRGGPATPVELAERAGIHPRYAREWLEQQAVAGVLAVTDPGVGRTEAEALGLGEGGGGHAGPEGARSPDAGAAGGEPGVGWDPVADRRQYSLPAAHRGALVDPVDPGHLAPFAGLVAGIGAVLDDVVEAYRTGAGVPFARYGADLRNGQGGINRPAFATDLVTSWLPATAGVVELLGGGGRVVDVGTGQGWAAIAVKSAFPAARVTGIDGDAASIADAGAHARQAGVEVDFRVVDAADPASFGSPGSADVVLILEVLHDLARPVEALAAARAALSPGGVVVVADEAVAERFTAPGDEIERLMYGWSITHCLPAAMAESPSAALGTVLRPGTVLDLARQAGFAEAEVVDVDAGFFRIYRFSS